MYQKKGDNPERNFPNFKMLVPVSETATVIVSELLEDLGITYKPTEKRGLFITHIEGAIGEGSDIGAFINAALPEMTITELRSWKIVPLKMTLSEVEEMLGHKLEIIEEEK